MMRLIWPGREERERERDRIYPTNTHTHSTCYQTYIVTFCTSGRTEPRHLAAHDVTRTRAHVLPCSVYYVAKASKFLCAVWLLVG